MQKKQTADLDFLYELELNENGRISCSMMVDGVERTFEITERDARSFSRIFENNKGMKPLLSNPVEKGIAPVELQNYIISKARKGGFQSKFTTPLALQKILYFVNCEYMLHKGKAESLFNDSDALMKWKFGATYPKAYATYQFFGSFPVTDLSVCQILWDEKEFEKEILKKNITLELLDSWIEIYLQLEPFDLVDMTHGQHIWKKDLEEIRNGNRNIPYDINELYEEILNNPDFFKLKKL